MQFFTRFSPNPARSDYVENMKSLAQQQFLEKSDINWIVKHYEEIPETGIMSTTGPRMPLWGDFSNVPDPLTAHNIFCDAEASFNALPAAVRLRFGNDPVLFLQFCSDPANREEAKRLGLIVPEVEPVIAKADSVSAVNAQTAAESAASTPTA